MALYYITGTPGSGKTTVLAELKRRGYEAYGTDEDGLASFYHTVTGKQDFGGQTAEERTEDWRRYREWKVPAEKVEALRVQAVNKTIFLCGVSANDATDFWDKFARVFCLYIPPAEVKRRILARPENNFGKNAHELASVLEWAGYAKQQYTDLGAIIIDATQPVANVVDAIIEHISNER